MTSPAVVPKIQTPPVKSGGAALPSIRVSKKYIDTSVASMDRLKKGPGDPSHFDRSPVRAQPALAGTVSDKPVKPIPIKLSKVHGPDVTEANYPPAIETSYVNKQPKNKQMRATLSMIDFLVHGNKRFDGEAREARQAQKLLG